MAIPSNVFTVGRALGDTSSATRGVSGVRARIRRRAFGRVFQRGLARMGIFGLIAWAEFLDFIRDAIRSQRNEPVWIASGLPYAQYIEKGFTAPNGRHIPGKHVFKKAARRAENDLGRFNPKALPVSGVRSGVYAGGRYLADVRSVAKGTVGRRLARRGAGASVTRFFFGTLGSDANPSEQVAVEIAKRVREEIRRQGIKDTGAYLNSIAIGETKAEAREESLKKAKKYLVFTGQTDKRAEVMEA